MVWGVKRHDFVLKEEQCRPNLIIISYILRLQNQVVPKLKGLNRFKVLFLLVIFVLVLLLSCSILLLIWGYIFLTWESSRTFTCTKHINFNVCIKNMYLKTYICIYIYTHTHIHIHTHIRHIYTDACTCMYIYIHVK